MAREPELGGSTAPPVIGRSAVLEELLAQLQRTRAGPGRCVLLVGPGGVGKSTVLRAVAEVGAGLEFVVLEGRSLPVDLPEPFQLVRSLLKSAQSVTARSPSADQESVPSLPMFLAPFERDTEGGLARATGLAGPTPESAEADRLLDHLANPVERIDANRSALSSSLSEFFQRLGGGQPLLVVLDDLHFADSSSLEFLSEFLPALEKSRILLLASTIPPAENRNRSRGELQQIAASPHTSTLLLPPMTEPELGEYVRWLLKGRDPGREAVMRWFTQTEGNPLFTEYLVRASGGAAEPATTTEASHDFGELLKARIRSLPETERRLLVYGSVLGKEFEFPLLAVASGQEEERLTEALDHLVHLGILREKRGEVYEFVSERVRADVYAQLTETRRRLLHRKVGEALESRGDDSSAAVVELARQLYLGRDDKKAVDYNRRAADLAANAFAFDTAVIHLERAIEAQRRLVPRETAQEVRLMVELGRYLDELGDLRRSEEVLLDAVARARTEPALKIELAFALLGLAQTRSDLSQYASTRDLASEAFGLMQGLDQPRGLLAAHRVLGVAHWRMGNLAKATEHQREELQLAEAHGTPTELGHALIDLANTLTLGGPRQTKEAMGLYERAASILDQSADQAAHARVLMNLALLLYYDARPDEALEKMRGALTAAERSRSRIWIGYCSLNLAQFYSERHDIPSARTALERAQGLLEPLGDQLAHQQITMIRGMVAAEDGDLEGAEKLFGQAAGLARSLDLSAEVAEMEFRFAQLEVRRGDIPLARKHLTAARAAGLERLRADLLPRVSELEQSLREAPKAPHG